MDTNPEAPFDDAALLRIGQVWDAMERTGLDRLRWLAAELHEEDSTDA